MPKVAPSEESKQRLDKPIKVVNRFIPVDSVVRKHNHSWGQFIYAQKGILSVVTDSNRYIIPPEQGVWILPYINHEVTTLTDVELTSFYFYHEAQHELPEYCCVLSINNFLKTLIQEVKKAKFDYHWSDVDGLLLRLIQQKLSLASVVTLQLPYPKDKRLLSMLSIIQKDPSIKCNLAQWGKVVGASSRTLSRLFKYETGMTYSKWRLRLNVQIAITKLGNGEPIAKVASDLGYESPSAFSYMFRENTGNTPSYYRDRE